MPPCEFKACRKGSLLPAFSLIELLVVMAIVLALAGIAANGIFGSSQNARLTSRDRVKAKLQQARAHAIATRNPTALIVPVEISGKYALRAMSLIEVEKIDGRYVPMENENGDSALVQRWTALPGNFHFVTNRMIGSEQPTVVDPENTLTIRQRGNEIDCHMIVFAPNGQIAWPSSGSPIHIAIAQVAGNRNSFRISEISNGKPVFDLLVVNRLTAQTRSIKP